MRFSDAQDTVRILRRASREIEAILGHPGRTEMIHRDDLVLLGRGESGEVAG